MNMFSRSDRTLDTNTTGLPGRSKGESAVSVAADVRPTQVSAQTGGPSAAHKEGPSIISKAVKVTGQVESTEDIQIDGEVLGDVHGNSIKIGKAAKITGTVYGDEVELAGTIEGNIEAKKVTLTSTARMSGDLVHLELKVESGAYINGRCRPEFGKASGKDVHPTKPAAIGREQATLQSSGNVGVSL